jgi:hypothetical protein
MVNNTDTDLPVEAQSAWLAYQAMSESKKTYFSFLMELDQKYKHGGTSTFAENIRLEKLLKLHNEKVFEFSNAMSAVEDKDARETLLIMMGATNSTAGTH